MSYLVLARKYRPQRFEDIIGQEHIARVLKNAIKDNRVAHGYIFSGQRGVGKTTTARIFAKALNCKNGPTEEPCNKCRNCEEIIKSNSIDVIEIDGASNRGIEEIRNLRENIKYAPAASKYKIYIIDEAHQITDAAFNALLKTLEEPPEHSIFVMATTDPQKIPDTILSRCQRFNFRPVSIKDISENILKIAKIENIVVDEKAVNLIARSAGGSMRDSLSIFDQIISFCGNNITVDEIISVLGMLKEDTLTLMTEHIYKNDTGKLLSAVRDTVAAGYDPLSIAADLQSYIRNVLLNKTAPDIIYGVSDKEKLDFYSQKFSTDVLLRLINILSECIYQMKNAEQPVLILDVFCVKLTQKYIGIDEIVKRLEAIECGTGSDENNAESDAVPSDTDLNSDGTTQKDNVQKYKSNISSVKIREIWKSIIENNRENPVLASCMTDSKIAALTADTAMIEFKNKFAMDIVTSNENIWRPVLEEKSGGKINLKYEIFSDNQFNQTVSPEIDEPAIEEEEDESVIPQDNGIENLPETASKTPVKLTDGKKSKEDILAKEPIAKTILDLFGGTIKESND